MRVVAVLTLVLLGLSGCQNDLLRKEMGKTEQDYVQRYGPATKSPMTPDQVAFEVAPGTRLVVRFVSGSSIEELWLLAPDLRGLPEAVAAEAKKIDLQFSCAPEMFIINADRNNMEAVFTNLLSNAIKYTPEGGRVGMKFWTETDGTR